VSVLYRLDVPFEIGRIRVKGYDSDLLAVVSEKMGRRITVMKMSLDATKLKHQRITFSWRKPGDNNLFSSCIFGIVKLYKDNSLKQSEGNTRS
jgi:hypothetical protein